FQEIQEHTVSGIYSEECGWNTWHGYTVMAIDGSKTQLPNDPALLEAFGGTGAGAKAPTAQASFLYDPLNDIIVDAKLAPLSTDERTLAKEHLMALSRLTSIKKKLILFDHGYPSSDLIAALQASHCDFLLRVRSKFSIALDALDMGVHPFDFPCDDGNTIPLVAVKLTLDIGETEMLQTSIQDKRMGAKAFKELYFARWGVEVRINDLKHKVEIENFLGRLENNLYHAFPRNSFLSEYEALWIGAKKEPNLTSISFKSPKRVMSNEIQTTFFPSRLYLHTALYLEK
ncbi:MAG: transposase, partial [Clostridia bacterium]